jgi:hypothetical protein
MQLLMQCCVQPGHLLQLPLVQLYHTRHSAQPCALMLQHVHHCQNLQTSLIKKTAAAFACHLPMEQTPAAILGFLCKCSTSCPPLLSSY